MFVTMKNQTNTNGIAEVGLELDFREEVGTEPAFCGEPREFRYMQ